MSSVTDDEEADFPPARALAPGALFGNYEVVRKIGEGGMGAVYEARRTGLDKRVALKVLTVEGSASAAARFVREARIAATLEHPHVADCLDVGVHDDTPYLALEYLDGETLGARMRRGPMPINDIVEVLLPVCSALHVAHQRGIVHRDLKPENIFLARKLGVVVPKVLDFGIAKARTDDGAPSLTRTASIMGTPGYMSPEQARDSKHVDGSSDQFALGVIAWEALAGRSLFSGTSVLDILMKVVSDAPPPLRSIVPSVPPEFERILARLLAKEPAERFASAHAVGAALRPFARPSVAERWAAEFDAAPASVAEAHAETFVDERLAPPLDVAKRPSTTLSRSASERSIHLDPPRRSARSVVLPAAAVVVAAEGGAALLRNRPDAVVHTGTTVAHVTMHAEPAAPAPSHNGTVPVVPSVTAADASTTASAPAPPAVAPPVARGTPAAEGDEAPANAAHHRPRSHGAARRRREID